MKAWYAGTFAVTTHNTTSKRPSKTPCAQPGATAVVVRRRGPVSAPTPEVAARVQERVQEDLRRKGRDHRWSRNRPHQGQEPVPYETTDPACLEIERRQRELHEQGLPTTNAPDLENLRNSKIPPDLFVLMSAREAVAWGPRSYARLVQEIQQELKIPRQEAERRLRDDIAKVEKKARGEG